MRYTRAMAESRDELLASTAALYGQAIVAFDLLRMHNWDSQQLTFPQLKILHHVRAHPGVDLNALAIELGVARSTARQHLDGLLTRGLVERPEDATDRRHLALRLSERGEQALKEISRAGRVMLRESVEVLSDAELAEFRRLLGRIVSAGGVASKALPAPDAVHPSHSVGERD